MAEDLLVPRNMYMKYKVHICPEKPSKYIRDHYVYKARGNVYIYDIEKIDRRIRDLVEIISKYKPEDVVFACRDKRFEIPLKRLEKLTGFKVIVGRYLPGSFTNPSYPFFFEPKVIVVLDPEDNENIIKDAIMTSKLVITFGSRGVSELNTDMIIPANTENMSALCFILWLIVRELYLKWGKIKSKEEFKLLPEDFIKKAE